MAQITLGGNPITTSGHLPAQGSRAPALSLTSVGLKDVTLEDFEGSKILNIFPSVDTGVCALSVRTFNQKAGALPGVTVLNVSADLPFAHKRFCASEGLEGVHGLSTFRSGFAADYGVRIEDGPMRGLCARAVVVIDAGNTVVYTEQVPEIAQEPDYDAALSAL